jgi:hypothetical protein
MMDNITEKVILNGRFIRVQVCEERIYSQLPKCLQSKIEDPSRATHHVRMSKQIGFSLEHPEIDDFPAR